ncbi:hypothetical protein PEX2_074960 [Penicillium expansum]|uniref:Uncharacterized protein n=1 Tax=Penicillium expansum TaxID=27334 RepID=A0A0A2I650_PENEN|nr:hypothetical protein PEX2_074960 [Penicillium expansum]KGO38579.1 hypothetical protein PEXP_082720 [Penicillium expansum]KGO59516.1 hypothetical protein PEX2_074960 [Penicillium expansum]
MTGVVDLPPYEQTTDKQAIVHPGEVYCHLTGCWRGRVPLAETRNLRDHPSRHGLMVAWTPSGRISEATKAAVAAWYESLFDDEEKYNLESNEEDNQAANGEQDHNGKVEEGRGH